MSTGTPANWATAWTWAIWTGAISASTASASPISVSYTHLAQSAARQAAAAIADRDAIAVEHKAENDFVTQMDRLSERIIMQRLTDAFPEDGFFGEEGGMRDQRQHEGCWIIDPIDGTTNYIQGIPTYTISIGYQYRGELTLGVVYCCLLYTSRCV